MIAGMRSSFEKDAYLGGLTVGFKTADEIYKMATITEVTNTSIFTTTPATDANTPANVAARVNANATVDKTNPTQTPVDRAQALLQQGESLQQIAIALGLNVTLVAQLLGVNTATTGSTTTSAVNGTPAV